MQLKGDMRSRVKIK